MILHDRKPRRVAIETLTVGSTMICFIDYQALFQQRKLPEKLQLVGLKLLGSMINTKLVEASIFCMLSMARLRCMGIPRHKGPQIQLEEN